MELTVNLAGTNITITLLGEAKSALPLCNQFFRDFLQPGRRGDAEIKVSILRKPNGSFPALSKTGKPIYEQRLPTRDVAAWLKEVPGYKEDFSISERTICSSCLDGLLLFDPETAAGRIYLLKQGHGCFQPIYRLFWMYFAQVLGEEKGCFVHSAALVKNDEAYVLIGESGAGKSTLSEVCRGCMVFSDDGPIFRKWDGEYHVFPSPYHQLDASMGLNKEVPAMSAKIKGLYFLTKDDRVYLEDLPKKKAISLIINRHIHFFLYLSAQARSAIFDLFFETCNKLPTYYLHFCGNQDVFRFISH